jgi:hypothetical protein
MTTATKVKQGKALFDLWLRRQGSRIPKVTPVYFSMEKAADPVAEHLKLAAYGK